MPLANVQVDGCANAAEYHGDGKHKHGPLNQHAATPDGSSPKDTRAITWSIWYASREDTKHTATSVENDCEVLPRRTKGEVDEVLCLLLVPNGDPIRCHGCLVSRRCRVADVEGLPLVGRHLGDGMVVLSRRVVGILLPNANHNTLRVVPQIKQDNVSAKQDVPNQNPPEARRRLLNTRLVGESEVPVVVSDVKGSTSNVEVKGGLELGVLGVAHHTLPLVIGGFLEKAVHGAVRDDEARGSAVHDGREVAKPRVLGRKVKELSVAKLERERHDNIVVDSDGRREKHPTLHRVRIVTPKLNLRCLVG
mmetsp:Transcript_3146/g.7593  ORF Transcript_3146/g.7593 Transcript_3146/m.7593 type:complete len:307 (-) Transcript_3146:101-1021(-)